MAMKWKFRRISFTFFISRKHDRYQRRVETNNRTFTQWMSKFSFIDGSWRSTVYPMLVCSMWNNAVVVIVAAVKTSLGIWIISFYLLPICDLNVESVGWILQHISAMWNAILNFSRLEFWHKDVNPLFCQNINLLLENSSAWISKLLLTNISK